MAERSFAEEVKKLRLGEGEVFVGEGILAVTKALLQSGVAYVGGYQGSPISHLLDVMADARDILEDLGVHFEANGSEAAAAAMLAASIHYPMRGAIAFKSTVGTNVASDALSNLASAGVVGGAMVVLGEDYGEGASIMQERSHAYAMKSQMWLLDPRPNLPSIVHMVEQGFDLSEASNTPVFLMLRVRACHVTGEFVASDNRASQFGRHQPVSPIRNPDKIVLAPGIYQQEKQKIEERLPAARAFIKQRELNEVFQGTRNDMGIILQGGLYNMVVRALLRLGLADAWGNTEIPLYVLNVTYPLVPEEVLEFCAGKGRVLVVEEGQPDYLEQSLAQILGRAGSATRLMGKGPLPMAGEYTGQVILEGLRSFLAGAAQVDSAAYESTEAEVSTSENTPAESDQVVAHLAPGEGWERILTREVPERPPGLCIGCPERPLFSAISQVEADLGPFHVSADIGCHSFATLPPFNVGNTILGYGLSLASSAGIRHALPHKAISIMGDGGFWHNGLSSGVASAVFNRHDGLLIIVNNGYSAATGGQAIPSATTSGPSGRESSTPNGQSIEQALRGGGVSWVRTLSTYDIDAMKRTLREALTSSAPGLKAIVAEGECMLNRQRRERPIQARNIDRGARTLRTRFYIDPQTCTGDHACVRISGCPSLTIRQNPDPLREDPVSYVDNNCVGCGVCGSNAQSAVLCPSFARVDLVHNPSWKDRALSRMRTGVIGFMQRRAEHRDRFRQL